MANDLTVTLGANVDNAVSNLKRAGNSVEELKNKTDAVDKRLRSINWGMIGGSLAVGFQDAASVVSMGGSMMQGLNAMGNNLVFAMSLVHPLAGGFTAAAVAAAQIGGALMKSTDNTKSLKKEAEEYKKVLEATATAHVKAAGMSAGVTDQRQAYKRIEEIDKQRKIAKAELDAANALVPTNPAEKIVKSGLVGDAMREFERLNIARNALSATMKDLPLQSGLTDETKSLLDKTHDLENSIARLKVPEGYLRDLKELEQEMEKLQANNLYSRETLSNYEKARKASINQAQAIREEAEAEKVHQGVMEQAMESRRNLDRLKSDAMNERMKLDPMARWREEAKRLQTLVVHGGLDQSSVTKLLASQMQGSDSVAAFSAPGVRRGSVEEAQLMNRARTESMRSNAAEAQAKIIAEAVKAAMLEAQNESGLTKADIQSGVEKGALSAFKTLPVIPTYGR